MKIRELIIPKGVFKIRLDAYAVSPFRFYVYHDTTMSVSKNGQMSAIFNTERDFFDDSTKRRGK